MEETDFFSTEYLVKMDLYLLNIQVKIIHIQYIYTAIIIYISLISCLNSTKPKDFKSIQ